MLPTRSAYRAALSPIAPQFFVVEVRRKINGAEQACDAALLSTPEKLSERLVHCFFLCSKAADLLGSVQQAVINLKICGHGHTMRHTVTVSTVSKAIGSYSLRKIFLRYRNPHRSMQSTMLVRASTRAPSPGHSPLSAAATVPPANRSDSLPKSTMLLTR